MFPSTSALHLFSRMSAQFLLPSTFAQHQYTYNTTSLPFLLCPMMREVSPERSPNKVSCSRHDKIINNMNAEWTNQNNIFTITVLLSVQSLIIVIVLSFSYLPNYGLTIIDNTIIVTINVNNTIVITNCYHWYCLTTIIDSIIFIISHCWQHHQHHHHHH